jgi:spermidine synthase
VIPWVQLDTAEIPDGGQLRLMQRGAEYSIMSGAIELMNSRLSGSEKALASLACERLAARAGPHILIGGLGMGFTLRAALADLPAQAKVTVAELVPAVIAWARAPMAHLHGDSLTDPRVTIRQGDVADAIRAAPGAYDAILLDVDNGPGGLNRDANDSLYAAKGLAQTHRALKPGGILAVWSAGPDAGFTRRLLGAGFEAEEHQVRATGGRRGARHLIWLATR